MNFDRTVDVYEELEALRSVHDDSDILSMMLAVMETNYALNVIKKTNVMLGEYNRNAGA